MAVAMTSVLFVCLGNICRSPLAEGALRQVAARLGLDLVIDSAGTAGWHAGKAPDPRAQAVALRNGCDIAGLRARALLPEDFRRFAHIYVMDRDNLADVRAMMPASAAAAPALLLDLVPGREGHEVADPWYGEAADFERTWAEVTAAAEALARRLQGHP